ncbi:MAG: type II secretion system protein [Terriglobales bacterium]|jgi:general secretion pathway protein G
MTGRATGRNRGFTLIEIMVVISIILILLGVALPIYSHSITRAREQNLRQNLETLNKTIYQYTQDKKKAPQSLEDLKAAKYLERIPEDITGSSDTWQTEPADAILSLEQTDTQGIIGVHSGSDKIGSDGTAYSTW